MAPRFAPSCGSVEAYEARRPNGALRFRCKGCKKDFTITSGTLFASHNLPLRGYLAAIAVFCNEGQPARVEWRSGEPNRCAWQ
jgi:transposase-like protein